MSTLDSASTYDDIRAAYFDSISYAEDNSVAKARALLTAIYALRRHEVLASGKGGASLTMPSLDQDLVDVKVWLGANDTRSTRVVVTGVGER